MASLAPHRSWSGWVLLVLFSLSARSAGAAAQADARPVFEAVRTHTPPRMDGKLDEPAWKEAPAFSAFHQSFPNPGAPPSERTEVYVLYDDAHLYVGIRCFDHQPSTINAQLGPRDGIPASDVVRVMIDSLHDRYTGTVFSINAGGTLEDARITQDTRLVPTWNGAWEGKASRDEQGWGAELRIPLRLLRFPRLEEQHWGFHVRREIARTHERLDSVPLPPGVNTLVSSFTELRALRELDPPWYLTLVPYVATRLVRPESPQAPGIRLLEPSLDVGLDAQLGLTSDLNLTLALNPDFGQVPLDPLLFNITTTEPFFREQRPFFLEGLELFTPVVAAGLPEQNLFYSRRIGVEPNLPLLAAVKLSGTVRRNVQVSFLDALVAGAADTDRRDPPDRRIRIHPGRPLHLAPNYTLPEQVPPPSNFLAGAARVQVADGAMLGTMAALNMPLSSECPVEDPETGDCAPRGGRAAVADLSLRSPSGDYTLAAQLTGSQVTGGPAEGVLLPEGTLLREGDTGFGAQFLGGKLGGEPWQFSVAYSHASPRLELNPTGFQPLQNVQRLRLNPVYFRTGWAGLPQVSLGIRGRMDWSTDERTIPLGALLSLDADVQLPDSTASGCYTETALAQKDLREIPRLGVAVERPSVARLGCYVTTDTSRPLALDVSASVERLLEVPVSNWLTGQDLSLSGTWKPRSRLETSLGAGYQNTGEGPRWLGLEEVGGGLLFGERTSHFLTLTLRQLVVLTPGLSLQAYVQVFSGYGRYDRFYVAQAARGDTLLLSGLSPTTVEEDPSFQLTELRSRVVLQYEFALGSTLFIVYTRTQSAAPPRERGPVRLTLLPQGLSGGLHLDSLQVKFGWML